MGLWTLLPGYCVNLVENKPNRSLNGATKMACKAYRQDALRRIHHCTAPPTRRHQNCMHGCTGRICNNGHCELALLHYRRTPRTVERTEHELLLRGLAWALPRTRCEGTGVCEAPLALPTTVIVAVARRLCDACGWAHLPNHSRACSNSYGSNKRSDMPSETSVWQAIPN